MDRADVAKLQQTHADPAVSILMPTQRRRPGNQEDPALLRDLLHEAEDRLVDTYGTHDATPIAAKLEAAADDVDFDHPGDALAIFGTRETAEAFTLDFTVSQRVVVGETFATRDLVRGLARRPRYRVIVLSEKPSRLFDATGDQLEEIRAGGFPLTIEGAQGEPLASGGYAPHTSRSNQQLLDFFRRVDHALDDVGRAPPHLVVVGVERDLAYFDTAGTHADLVIGRVTGNHSATGARELAELVRPVVEDHLRKQQAGVVTKLVDAAGARRLARGIDEVWRCAHEGRGHLLAVQDGYDEPPRRSVNGKLEVAVDLHAGDVIRDAVDDVIETVLEHGGDVIFMDPGTLGEFAPIALTLRW